MDIIRNEKGHALYLSLVIGVILLVLVTHLLTSSIFHIRTVHLVEQSTRADILVQSAIRVYLAEQSSFGCEGMSPPSGVDAICLNDGLVTFEDQSESENEPQFLVVGYVPDASETRAEMRVRVWFDENWESVTKWRDLPHFPEP